MYQLLNHRGIRRLSDGATIPDDEGNRDYRDYLAWLAKGNQPAPVEVTPFATLAKAYLDEVRETRERVLNRLAGIAAAALAAGDTTTSQAFVKHRQELLDITKAPAVLAATNMAELKTAVTAIYKGIAAAAPVTIRNAFNNVDA